MPARPTKAPEMVRTRTVAVLALIPAVLPAAGLDPMTRKVKPSVLRFISHHASATTASAIRNPTLTRRPEPRMWGNRALVGMVLEIELFFFFSGTATTERA